VSNDRRTGENRQSALFSTKKGRWLQNEELLLQLCHAKDLTIVSRSRLSSEFVHVLGPAQTFAYLWRYCHYTAFPISLCNELVRLSILRCRERNAWNRPAVFACGCDPS